MSGLVIFSSVNDGSSVWSSIGKQGRFLSFFFHFHSKDQAMANELPTWRECRRKKKAVPTKTIMRQNNKGNHMLRAHMVACVDKQLIFNH